MVEDYMTDAELYELKSKYKALQAEIKALSGPKEKRAKTEKYVSEPTADMVSPETLAKLEQLKAELSVAQKQADEARVGFNNLRCRYETEAGNRAKASPEYTIFSNLTAQVAEREKSLALPIPIGSVWRGGRYGSDRL